MAGIPNSRMAARLTTSRRQPRDFFCRQSSSGIITVMAGCGFPLSLALDSFHWFIA